MNALARLIGWPTNTAPNALNKPPALYGDKYRGKLYPGEDAYYRENSHVAGMAADDGMVTINPYSQISDQERQSVYENEAARLFMREKGTPGVDLTELQDGFLNTNTYRNASKDDRIATILARLISGDPSAGDPTFGQTKAANKVRSGMEPSSGEFNALSGYGNRRDGTQKGSGYFGPITTPKGDTMTEFSISLTGDDGKDFDIPLLVPGLDQEEYQHLISGNGPTDSIVKKAIDHYRFRQKRGLPAYWTPVENVQSLPR
jgi:hypothetical protein